MQQVEELYFVNPHKLQHEVEPEELRLHKQLELKRLAEEKEREAQKLRKAGKKQQILIIPVPYCSQTHLSY